MEKDNYEVTRWHNGNSLESAWQARQPDFDALQARIAHLEQERVESLAQEPVKNCWLGEFGVHLGSAPVGARRLFAKPMPPTIPEGMVLMPVDPSYQMLAQGSVACPVFGLHINGVKPMYQAMIAAAPESPE